MSTQWLPIQSFQRSQNLLAAINTLSIHIKLGLVGIQDEGLKSVSELARETLVSFLKKLETVVREAEQGEAKP